MNRARTRVVAALEQAATPLGVTEIAARAGLEVSAARHHLAALEAEGRAVGTADRAGHRGRPRVLWHARPASAGPYEHLAMALLRARSTGESLDEAARAVAPAGRDLVAFLAAEGFDPRPEGDCISLGHCPLDAAVTVDPGSVCTVHRGLIAAFADRSGQPAVLEVNAPGRCRVRRSPAAPVHHHHPDSEETS